MRTKVKPSGVSWCPTTELLWLNGLANDDFTPTPFYSLPPTIGDTVQHIPQYTHGYDCECDACRNCVRYDDCCDEIEFLEHEPGVDPGLWYLLAAGCVFWAVLGALLTYVVGG